MKPGIIYRGSFLDVQADSDNQLDEQLYVVEIYDHGTLIDDSATEEEIEMEMAGEPVSFITINNNEDKFSPILSTQIEIKVLTDSFININTFAGGDDNRWEVKIWLANQILFRGYLKLDDIQQDFMPDPNELLLVATDNLDVLQDVPLTDDNGDTIRDYNKTITYIANALKKTGLELEIKVINNIREQDTAPFISDVTFAGGVNQIGVFSGPTYFAAGKKIKVSGSSLNDGIFTITAASITPPTASLTVAETVVNEVGIDIVFNDAEGHFYEHEYLEAKTFEGDEVGVSHDCSLGLEKILGEHCRLFQHWGKWFIVSVDELDDNDLRQFTFDSDGVFDINSEEVVVYDKDIGIDKSIFFINEDALVKATRPHKYIKETFNLETPKEIICNIDFSRGIVIDDVLPLKTYSIECWTMRKNFYTTPYGTPTVDATIEVLFDDLEREEERYISIPPVSNHVTDGLTYLESQGVEVGENDRFDASVSWRLTANADFGSGYNLMRFWLHGDDGSDWLLGHQSLFDSSTPLKWWDTTNFTVNTAAGQLEIDFTVIDEMEWQNISFEAPSIPVTGKLYIQLYQINQTNVPEDNRTIHYTDLQFSFYGYLNGSYKSLKAQYHKITSEITDNKVKREKDVFISDSPRKIFKGALTKYDGDDYILTETFFKYNIFFDTEPLETDYRTFGEWQAWWVWNQFRLANREFDFTAQGIDSNALISTTPNPISPLHKYFLTDTNESTTGRHFMLLHHEANIHLGEWTGFISEVFNEAEGKDYDETTETTSTSCEWWQLVYNTGGGNITAYFLDVPGGDNPGFYDPTGLSVPPFPTDADLADFTYTGGGGITDICTYLGILIGQTISFAGTNNHSNVSVVTTIAGDATHEFKYVLE